MKTFQCSFHVGPTLASTFAARLPGAEPGTERVYLEVRALDRLDARITVQGLVSEHVGVCNVPRAADISVRPARVRL
jgi:hypothetical protein